MSADEMQRCGSKPMTNLSRVVLLFLAAVTAVPLCTQSAFAQSSDFSVTIEASIDQQEPADRIAAGQSVDYLVEWSGVAPVDTTNLAIEVEVPGITEVTEGPQVSCDASGNPVRCTFGQFLNSHGYVWLRVRIDTPGLHTTTARVIRLDGSSDGNPANDVATHRLEALALPSVRVIPGISWSLLRPGEEAGFSLSLQNRSATPATNVRLEVTLPAGGTILAAEPRVGVAGCAIGNNTVVCTKASLVMDEALQINFSITAPPRMDGEDLVVEMVETQGEQDLDPSDNQRTSRTVMVHQFVVENTGDEGAGSLRQAMHDVNALCPPFKPCAILFRIPAPVPEGGWFTIQPRTPLPETSGTLTFDGTTQTSWTGDTNPDGPEIEIDGALVHEQSGLRLKPVCFLEVRNLAVNGFPGYGIEVRHTLAEPGDGLCLNGAALLPPAIIHENYLGTDPRGRIAKPNQRGLGIFTPEAHVFANLISGNQRAGIYVQDGVFHDISGNRIGVGTDGSPLGNGAGIFIDMGNLFRDFIGADITYNVIAYNKGMAIARTRRGEILISQNSIFDNLQQGIDAGVDGRTAQRADDLDVPNAPVLFGAAYDPVRNATIVRGRIDSEAYATGDSTPGSGRKIEVYASLRLSGWGEPQAERSMAISSIPSGHQDFEIVVPGDLRGLWITATHSASYFVGFLRDHPRGLSSETHRESSPGDTSELSNAVTVQ
jgi:uncharacterized repeat protein (TIGR01451 family)